jgi:hypothetical protein
MKQVSLDDPNLAPYTRGVLARIDPDVLASLTEHQFRSIRDAIDASRPIRRHSIDVRGTIPLGFTRWYYVLLAGRDRRTDAREQEARRKRLLGAVAGAVVLTGVVLVPVTVLLVLVGYAIKSFLGLDLAPDLHLIDVVR